MKFMLAEPVLARLDKKGVVVADKHGYRQMLIGSLGSMNSAGEFYSLESASEFSAGSRIQKKLAAGQLYGELDHPENKYPSLAGFIQRLLRVRLDNVSTHYKSVELDDELWKSPSNSLTKGEVGVVSWLKGHGPHKQVTEDSLSNPNINAAFSVRSLTDTDRAPTVPVKTITNAITFDSVPSQGMKVANKWMSPALEAESISNAEIDKLVAMASDEGLGLEADDLECLEDIILTLKSIDDSHKRIVTLNTGIVRAHNNW